ncbi:Metalloenzyme, LuxS/M16 peptidase-like protein [Pisolithus croceorrhizus]|nr:Metalloenzyme, LuxS/M16 peptidase-like protein [Pisolithus croceorrhizus]
MRPVVRHGSGKQLRRHFSQATLPPSKITYPSKQNPCHFAAVGLYIDAGSRYEDPSKSGASHFLDRMAFKSTRTRSSEDMAKVMDRLGGQIMASSARETIMYQSSHFDHATPLALLHLQPRSWTFKKTRPEVLHEVAYGLQGLGNPLICPDDRIDSITPDLLRQCIANWYSPERMVIAGAGMQHEQLVELVDKYFSSLKPDNVAFAFLAPLIDSLSRPTTSSSIVAAHHTYILTLPTDIINPINPGSLYVGGTRHIPSTTQEFDHLYLAFEGVGIHDDDIYALATMQVLLGGGGSFSAGGPGKGMYSRLYTHILNHFPQVDHCASFHHIYSDSSLFGLFASFVPDIPKQKGNTPAQILPHLAHQLSLLIYQSNQLKSSLMMALESRAVEVEDLGRQILVHDRKIPVTDMTTAIDKVSSEAIRRVATRLFGPQSGNKASIVTMGRGDLGDWQATFRKYGVAST